MNVIYIILQYLIDILMKRLKYNIFETGRYMIHKQMIDKQIIHNQMTNRQMIMTNNRNQAIKIKREKKVLNTSH